MRRRRAELDALQTVSPFAEVPCEGGGIQPRYVYELHFTERGIAVEDARVSSDGDGCGCGCGFWAIRALGMPSPERHMATPETWARLPAMTGMPVMARRAPRPLAMEVLAHACRH